MESRKQSRMKLAFASAMLAAALLVLVYGGVSQRSELLMVCVTSPSCPPPLPHSHLLLPLFASSVLTFTQHAHTISHVQPWYEVASDGDGLGPESVNMWKVPPKAAFVHSNTFQDPTKWNGDHTLNGKKFLKVMV